MKESKNGTKNGNKNEVKRCLPSFCNLPFYDNYPQKFKQGVAI
jgi:hypothetical protein